MKSDLERNASFKTTVSNITIGASVSLTAGLAMWVQRGASLVGAFLTSMPVWQRFDPLVIFSETNPDEADDKQSSRVERMFDNSQSHYTDNEA